MKIIFIGKNTAKPKSISLTFVILILLVLLSLNIYLFNYLIEQRSSRNIIHLDDFELTADSMNYRQNLDVYVEQIGELHSRILGIDQQTDRLQDVMRKQILGKERLPKLKKENKLKGEGGPFIEKPTTHKNIQKSLGILMTNIQVREDIYNKMEAMLLKQSVLKETLPTLYPVDLPYQSSSYGWRMDPFLGKRAFHEGVDFSAAEGEPIYATAGGIVERAQKWGRYGNLITIKHGGGLETRYAHLSKILVKKGQIVNKEELIGLVGNTGRSTGPHLHYEIRLNDHSLDPKQYLKRSI